MCSSTSATKSSEHPYYILSPKAVKSLPKYKYNGEDRSLIYKHILSPLAGFLVDNLTPSTIAPNSITLFGLFIMLSSYVHVYYHCPTLEQCSVDNDGVPGYIFLLNGIAILIYQTLDNMDGKQARKTGSSSPLGLLFDHGCDAINSMFGSVTWICAFALVPTDEYFFLAIAIMVYSPMFVFYVSTWEEYYTGKLDLPMFNGPSEGLLLFATFNFISWWFGRSFWHGTEIYDFLSLYLPTSILQMMNQFSNVIAISLPTQNYSALLFITLFTAVKEIVEKVAGVTMTHGLKPLMNLSPMVVLITWSAFIVQVDSDIFVRNQRCCFHLIALLFVEMVTKLMLDHITCETYKPFRKVLSPFFMIHVVAASGLFSDEKIDQMIWIYTGFMFIYEAVTMKTVVGEICDVLGICCFDIVTPKKKIM